MVGISTGYLCKPVLVHFRLQKLRFQVGLFHLFSFPCILIYNNQRLVIISCFILSRHRTFSFLFSEGENEELNASQKVESHSFPQHFIESKERIGLAPAAIVVSRREHYDTSSALKSLDYNRQLRSQSPAIGK